MRLTDHRLTDMALGALEEVAARCHHAPVPRSAALRLVLAFLASRQPCGRHAFDSFWRAVDHPRPQERWGCANAALNGIYGAVGRKRDTAVVSRYESAAREWFLAFSSTGPKDHFIMASRKQLLRAADCGVKLWQVDLMGDAGVDATAYSLESLRTPERPDFTSLAEANATFDKEVAMSSPGPFEAEKSRRR
jgi:hypothetical protein